MMPLDHTNVSYGLHYGRVYTEQELLVYILNCCFAATPRHFATPDKLSRFRSLPRSQVSPDPRPHGRRTVRQASRRRLRAFVTGPDESELPRS